MANSILQVRLVSGPPVKWTQLPPETDPPNMAPAVVTTITMQSPLQLTVPDVAGVVKKYEAKQ